MTQPDVIYASNLAGTWTDTPVAVDPGYPFWPNLDWRFDGITPTSTYKGEAPQYLFAATFNPLQQQTFTFARRWAVANASFTAGTITRGHYDIVLTHAADNLYTATLSRTVRVGGGLPSTTPLTPVISNQDPNFPSELQWRNVKTILYQDVDLFPSASQTISLQLETSVTNLALANSTPETNPGMFTWTLELYKHGNLVMAE